MTKIYFKVKIFESSNFQFKFKVNWASPWCVVVSHVLRIKIYNWNWLKWIARRDYEETFSCVHIIFSLKHQQLCFRTFLQLPCSHDRDLYLIMQNCFLKNIRYKYNLNTQKVHNFITNSCAICWYFILLIG